MILVIGATGNIGGKVLALLRDAGEKVRAVTRDPARADLPADVDVVAADLSRPETLPAALDGVQKVFLMSLGANKATHDQNLVLKARQAGVKHVVQLSTLGVETAEDAESDPLGWWHLVAESALRDTGLPWTILRPNGFMSMTLNWAQSIRTDGVARSPIADIPEAIVDPRDIAEVAVRALTESGHEGRIYKLTGPEALTAPQQVEVLASVLGRPLRFEQVSLADQRAMMLRFYSEETVDGVMRSIEHHLEHAGDLPGTIFDGIPTVLGRQPRTFRQWAEDHAHLFRG